VILKTGRYHRCIYLMLFLCCMVLFTSSCNPNSTEAKLTQINVACFPNVTHAQALLMKGQGTLEQAFEESGVSINWITFNAGPSQIEALFAGAVDIGFIGPVPAVSGYIQSSGDLHVIAGASNGGSVLVAREGSGILTAGDLDGRTVAIPQFGNTQHFSLLAILADNGLEPTTHGGTVSIVPSTNADIANLMDRGDIDAALVPEPWGSILELRRGARVILDFDEVDPSGIPATAIVIVRRDFMDAYPDAVARFIEAHKETTAYLNDNPDSAMRIINSQIAEITHFPIEYDVLESAFRRLQITYEIPTSSIMDFAQIGVDEGLLPRLPDGSLAIYTFIRG